MKCKKINDTYFIRLDKGEKVLERLRDFCSKNNIKAGYFFGIGSLDGAELAHYIAKAGKYTYQLYRQPLEIVSMNGNMTMMNNESHIHCHACLSDVNMEAMAGHLKEGIVGATCEIVLVKLDTEINRKYDDFTGLNLMDL